MNIISISDVNSMHFSVTLTLSLELLPGFCSLRMGSNKTDVLLNELRDIDKDIIIESMGIMLSYQDLHNVSSYAQSRFVSKAMENTDDMRLQIDDKEQEHKYKRGRKKGVSYPRKNLKQRKVKHRVSTPEQLRLRYQKQRNKELQQKLNKQSMKHKKEMKLVQDRAMELEQEMFYDIMEVDDDNTENYDEELIILNKINHGDHNKVIN